MSDTPPARPGTDVQQNSKDLLGVEKGYVPLPALTGGPGQSGSREPDIRAARYHKGDEHKPISWHSDEIIRTQQKLVIAGYLDPNSKYTLGSWDTVTEDAYKALLEDANQMGVDADRMFEKAASDRIPNGRIDPVTGQVVQASAASNAPPLQLQLPNRDDVARVIRTAAVDKLGQGWDDQQVNAATDAYIWQVMQQQVEFHQQEVAQAEAQAAGTPPPPSVQTQTESPETFAENFINKQDPAGVEAMGAVNQFINNASGFWKSPV